MAKTKMTAFGRFFLFMIVVIPSAYFGASYFKNGEIKLPEINTETSEPSTKSEGLKEEVLKLQDEVNELKNELEAVKAENEELKKED